MADNHEYVFEEEAQEAALRAASDSQGEAPTAKRSIRVSANEASPLLSSNVHRRQSYQRAGDSYQRAIDEPWNGAYGSENLPWYKKPSIYWLLPAFLPFCIAFGGLIVPRQYLILDQLCRDYLSEKAAKDPNFHFTPITFGQTDNPLCRDYHVQQRASYFNIYTDTISGVFSAMVTPYFGALSDRVGRKKVIVWASIGGLAAEIINIIIGTYPETVSVYWMLLGAFLDGICGSFTTGMALALAYGSDCSTPQNRASVFAYFQGTLFGGIALGPMLAAWMIKLTGGIVVVFWFAFACHIFFLVFTTLFVPESVAPERQMIAREKYAKAKAEAPERTTFQKIRKYNLFEGLWVLRPKGPGSSSVLRRNIAILALIDTTMFGVALGAARVIIIYAQYRYGWNAVDSSLFTSICGICRVICLFGLLPLLNKLFRPSDKLQSQSHRGSDRVDLSIVKAAIIIDFVACLGYSVAPAGVFMVISGVIGAFGGIGSPTLSAAITKHIPADRTGQVLGATGLLHALARFVGPVAFNLIYSFTVEFLPGFLFAFIAGIFAILFVSSWFLKPHVYLDESVSSSDERDGSVEQTTESDVLR